MRKSCPLPAEDPAAVGGAALTLLTLVAVEKGEVVVVGDLFAGQDVALGEDGHARQPVHVPLFHLAVGLA